MCALRFLVLTFTLVIITSSQPTEFNNGQCPQSDIAIHEMTEENRQLRHEIQKMRAELATIAMSMEKILTDVSQCPSEFLYRNLKLKSCYFFSKTKRSWTNARDDCIRRGAYLVEVQSKEEDDFLRGIVMAEGKAYYYMGGNDRVKEGQWMWQKSGKPFTYTNWAPEQPDNDDGIEHCLMYWRAIKWNDAPCDHQQLYICEKSHTWQLQLWIGELTCAYNEHT